LFQVEVVLGESGIISNKYNFYMSDLPIGLGAGLALGFAVGLSAGRKMGPMTKREKEEQKVMMKFSMVGLILLAGCTTPTQLVTTPPSTHVITPATGELSQSEIDALNLAINDEYKAKSTYQKVINKFGPVMPFSNIINSEQ
jgi:hypothetical protein